MKAVSIHTISTFRMLRNWLVAVMLLPFGAMAQADSAAAAAPEMLSPALDFLVVQKGDNSYDLKAMLRVKFKNNSVKLSLLKVRFVQVTDSAEKELGFKITDLAGKAVLNVPAANVTPDQEGKLHFKAYYAGNKSFDAAENEATFARARIDITPEKADSLLTVKVKVVGLSASGDTAVKNTTVGLYVKRMFMPLKIGEGTTDDNGEATIEVPQNLPGDAKGNLTFLAKIDENEQFGALESSAVQAWGTPVSDKSQELPRALWSSHPPMWMLITFIVLMLAVWGHYVVIVYEMFRLKKDEPHPAETK